MRSIKFTVPKKITIDCSPAELTAEAADHKFFCLHSCENFLEMVKAPVHRVRYTRESSSAHAEFYDNLIKHPIFIGFMNPIHKGCTFMYDMTYLNAEYITRFHPQR